MLNKDTKNRLFSYFTNKLRVRPYTRGWMKGDCPECGRHDKFGINLGMNRTNCFVCGFHPTPLRLVLYLEGLDNYTEVLALLKSYEGKQYLEPVVEKIQAVDVIFPDGYVNLALGSSTLAKLARAYVKGRGFDPYEKAYEGWGYGTKGEYFGYIIIPFYIGGKLIYYNARKFTGSGVKYKNPKIEDFGIGKSLIMYHIDALAMYDEIYLVEGAINADTIGDEAIASGGKKIADYQLSMIIKSDVEKINILLDPDAIDDSIKVAMTLCFHKQIRIVTWDGNDDVNDLGKDETLKRCNATPWMNYNQLLRMKHEKGTKFAYYQE